MDNRASLLVLLSTGDEYRCVGTKGSRPGVLLVLYTPKNYASGMHHASCMGYHTLALPSSRTAVKKECSSASHICLPFLLQ